MSAAKTELVHVQQELTGVLIIDREIVWLVFVIFSIINALASVHCASKSTREQSVNFGERSWQAGGNPGGSPGGNAGEDFGC